MEVYYEKNVTNNGIDKHKKRNVFLLVVRVIAIIWIVVSSFIFINFVDFSGADFLGVVLVILFLFAPPICLLIFANKLLTNLNLEYDYYLLGDTFRIVKVLNRKKRKKLLELTMASFAVVGLVESESFDRYSADKQVKQINAFCEENNLIYFYVNDGGEKKLIIIETDEKFLLELKKALPISVLDDSLKTHLFQLQKKSKKTDE